MNAVHKDAWLTNAEGKLLKLRTQRLTRLGRAIENDIVLEDSTVSQRHAVISFDHGHAFLRDLESSHGTFIEGARVPGGQLTDGSVIRLGRVVLVYRESVDAHSAASLESCPSCGDIISSGSLFCTRCGANLVSPPPDGVQTSPSAGNTSQRTFFSARTGAILGALFLLGSLAALASRAHFSSSSSPAGNSGIWNLADSQGFRLPNASSDFIGDWCGWTRVLFCHPATACNGEPNPNSIHFRSETGWGSSNSHSVVMQYQIVAPADRDIRDVSVHALDPHHVRVTYVVRMTDSLGLEHLANERQDIISINPTVVQDTEDFTDTVNGISTFSEEKRTELRKCSQQFLEEEQKYDKQHNMVQKGEVTGPVPGK